MLLENGGGASAEGSLKNLHRADCAHPFAATTRIGRTRLAERRAAFHLRIARIDAWIVARRMDPKGNVMMGESNRMLVAGGLLIGTLALAAAGLQFGNRESSAKEAVGRVDEDVSTAARSVTPGTPIADAQNAGIARVLQAVHDSLQLGDLASAHVLLDAVLAMRKDEPQAQLLQKELVEREARQTSVEGLTAAAKLPSHSHATVRSMHMQSNASRHEVTASVDKAAMDVRPDDAVHDDAPAANAVSTQSPAAPETSTAAAAVPVETTQQQPTPATPEPAATQSVAPSDPSPPVAAASDAPKTRAQVRDELRRARTNGSMSRFGNPDPYGPGGSPSTNAQSAARTQ
jgi:hypothetical protein